MYLLIIKRFEFRSKETFYRRLNAVCCRGNLGKWDDVDHQQREGEVKTAQHGYIIWRLEVGGSSWMHESLLTSDFRVLKN